MIARVRGVSVSTMADKSNVSSKRNRSDPVAGLILNTLLLAIPAGFAAICLRNMTTARAIRVEAQRVAPAARATRPSASGR